MAFLKWLIKHKLPASDFDDGYLINQVKQDIQQLSSEEKALWYTENFSPSKLGKLRLLGLRKLAQIVRDYPEIWERWKKEYKK